MIRFMQQRPFSRRSPLSLTPARLRWLLLALWLLLVIPTLVLVLQARQQIKWEALYQHRTLAEEFSQRIDERLQQWIAVEESRSPADYQFLVPGSEQLSTLAQWPVSATVPGLIGYFQVDEQGFFSTPLLPANAAESRQFRQPLLNASEREAVSQQLQDVLGANRLVEKPRDSRRNGLDVAGNIAPAPEASLQQTPLQESAGASLATQFESTAFESKSQDMASTELPYAQQNFDRLRASSSRQQKALGRIDELQLDDQFANAGKKDTDMEVEMKGKAAPAAAAPPAKATPERREMDKSLKKEIHAAQDAAVVQTFALGGSAKPEPSPTATVRLFENEVDPFEFALLDSGHFVLFRKVWQNGGRRIQGVLLDQSAFFDGVLRDSFQPTALAQMSNLILAFQGDVLRVVDGSDAATGSADTRLTSARDIRGTLLLQQKLSAPLGDLQLIFSLNRLPDGPGARVVTWTSLLLGFLLLAVFYALYRLGLHQIRLTRQQQDFVSAVSHELKTPLTSIRMFSEMLKEGWVGDDKRREYYHFISDESERLSRLIANVLQLARMERNDLPLDIRAQPVATLLDLIRSRVTSQVERSGFQVTFDCAPDCVDRQVLADTDAVVQIMLNLVDNALKFSGKAERRQIDISVVPADGGLVLGVRDYGPGIPAGQTRRIFDLFYRVGSELTRETQGTGIGLALVQQLARAMGGSVEVCNRQPGAEFRLQLRHA